MDAPKKQCCPQGSWPALKVDYHPKGEKFILAGTTVYHVGEHNSKVLIIFSDIFGAFSSRHLSVADTYASFGYNVYLPQILIKPYNEEVINMGNMMTTIKQQNWEKMQARFKALWEYLRQKGHKQFYAIGFCWGVYTAFKLASKYQGFKTIVGFHPSFGLCGLFNQSQKQLMESVKCPAFLLPCQNDPANIKQGGENLSILKKRFGDNKIAVHTFHKQAHGFVVRGDVTNSQVHSDVEQAIKLSKEYFQKF